MALMMVAIAGCSSPAEELPAPTDAVSGLRGQRYCEVVLLTLGASSMHADVYLSQGLNDCPDAAFTALDAKALAVEHGVTSVLLNGPRYWTLDAFVQAELRDPTVVTFGGLAMRLGGSIDFNAEQLKTLQLPYQLRFVQRKSTVRFRAGSPVFELIDTEARVYEMQSFSTAKAPLTEAELPGLAARLSLPSGWKYQARTPSTDILITAKDGLATVVQDDFSNTYQRVD